MDERLKQLRKHLDMTQQEFSERLNIPRTTIANYESSKKQFPSDAVISLICRTFNVNEDWLREGKGEMLIERSEDSEIKYLSERLFKMEVTTLDKRLKELRKSLGLTQQEFADRIGTQRGNIAGYEAGRKQFPSNAMISLICRTFNVNEDWLREGKGEMLLPQTRAEEMTNFFTKVLSAEPDDIRQRLISVFAKLDDREWQLMDELLDKLIEETKKGHRQ